jgi:Flp pilus assembly protein TadD
MFGRTGSAAQLLRLALGPVAVTALTALIYARALTTPFVYDDHYLIVENQSIGDLTDLWAIVVLQPTRPLVNLSYAIDHAIWGLNPFGYHLTNVLLHILNVILFYFLTLRLVEDRERRHPSPPRAPIPARGAAMAAALLLAIHPMMTSAVLYIAARAEVLCATFFLASLLCCRRWLLYKGRRWWVLCVLFWLAALGTKEVAVVLPLVLVCYEWFVIRLSDAQRRRSLILLMVPVALVAAAGRVATFMLVERPHDVVFQWRLVPRQLDVVMRYLALTLAPEGQAIFHVVPDIGFADPRTFAAAATLAGLLVLAWRVRKTTALVTFGVFWYLLVLIPSTTLTLVNAADPMAEHRVYVASCGLFLAIGTAAAWVIAQLDAARRPGLRLGLLVTLAVVMMSLAGRSLLRIAVWADPVALWQEAVVKAPDHPFPRLLHAEALQLEGRLDEAIVEYRAGIALGKDQPLAYQKLALALVTAGRMDEARATLEQLQRLEPRSAIASNGLGALALMAGEQDRAREFFLASLANDPQNVPARQSLAMIAEPVNPAEALRLCEEIQRIAPRTPGNDECIDRNRARLRAPANGR